MLQRRALSFLPRPALIFAFLRHQISNAKAKLSLQLFIRDPGILHGVMQQCCRYNLFLFRQHRCNHRCLQRMSNIGDIGSFPNRSFMCNFRKCRRFLYHGILSFPQLLDHMHIQLVKWNLDTFFIKFQFNRFRHVPLCLPVIRCCYPAACSQHNRAVT